MELHEIDNHITEMDKNLQGFNLCNTYIKIKPVLRFARTLLFFKPKWQSLIDELIHHLDKGCPQT